MHWITTSSGPIRCRRTSTRRCPTTRTRCSSTCRSRAVERTRCPTSCRYRATHGRIQTSRTLAMDNITTEYSERQSSSLLFSRYFLGTSRSFLRVLSGHFHRGDKRPPIARQRRASSHSYTEASKKSQLVRYADHCSVSSTLEHHFRVLYFITV